MPQATVWEHQDGTPVWECHDGAPAKSTIPTAGEMRMTQSGFQAIDSPSNVAISVDSEPETEASHSSQVTEEPVLVIASVKIYALPRNEMSIECLFFGMLMSAK